MTARRFLPLVPALLAACLATGVFEARAVEVIINDAVTRTNNNVILDGDDEITINQGGSITVDSTSPQTIGPGAGVSTFERNTAVLLRGLNAARVLIADSNDNTVTNRGTIRASGANAEGCEHRRPVVHKQHGDQSRPDCHQRDDGCLYRAAPRDHCPQRQHHHQ